MVYSTCKSKAVSFFTLATIFFGLYFTQVAAIPLQDAHDHFLKRDSPSSLGSRSASPGSAASPLDGIHDPMFKRQSPGSPSSPGTTSGPPSPQVYPAPNVTATGDWATAVNKAKAFVAQLTLLEKVNITTGIDTNGRCVGQTGTIPRLGFAGLCLEDSPLGVRLTDFNSAFPAGINAAMTWDKALIQARGQAMGAEHRGKGVNVALGPMMNMGRAAPAGRNWEGFGGDPYLTGVCSALTVTGMQSQGVIACAKHFVGNEQEHFRGGSGGGETSQSYSSDINDRTMHEIYAYPFGEAVNAGVGSIMCAYNRVNSTYACENSYIINKIAKEEWDFKGFLLSDWAAIEGGVPAAQGGVDMNQPGFVGYGIGPQDQENPSTATNSFWGAALVQFVQNGTVPQWRVDDMVTRIMAAYYKMGQDSGYPAVNFDYKSTTLPDNQHVNVQGNHATTIRQMGAASTVLLKYTAGVLPLTKSNLPTQIGIFGSDAGPNPLGPNGCPNNQGDRGCDQGTLAMGWGSGTAQFPYLIDPLSAITTWVHSQNPNVNIQSNLNDFDYTTTANIAKNSGLCMVFANSDSGEGYIKVDNNEGDRNNLTLWHGGDTLIQTTAANCKNTVVILHSVGPVIMEPWIQNPNITAVLFAGLPGQESGNSLVDVLTGAVNPSGRLPFTIAKNANDYPAQIVYSAPSSQTIIHIPYTEELQIDYRHFDANNIAPRYEFGFGLSYTKFTYSGLSVKTAGSFGVRKRTVQAVDVQVPSPGDSPALDKSDAVSAAPAAPTQPGSPVSVSSSRTATTATALLSGLPFPPPSATTAYPYGPIVTPTGGLGGNPKLYDDALDITFQVRNAGAYTGSEVAQVYLGFPASAGEPPKVLKGFEKLSIVNGQSATFTISLRNKDMAYWDVVHQDWVIPAGTFTIYVGASSRDIRLQGTFTNNKTITLSAS